MPYPRRAALIAPVLLIGALLAGCATTPPAGHRPGGSGLRVVAAENVWGDLAAQLGAGHVRVTNIIDSPDADPHEYEPTTADARAVATAQLVIVNGVGYDPWATSLVRANAVDGQAVLDVGDLVGVPPGGNPHRWYSPPDVRAMLDRLTAEYRRLDPDNAVDYQRSHDRLLDEGLRSYFGLIAEIRADFAGTPVGASESIFEPMATALGLLLRTPRSFLVAISEGADPTAADKATIDRQIAGHEIAVYVYNSQNATPDIARQIAAARATDIPVSTITETLSPAGVSFQDWQVGQLRALRSALIQAGGTRPGK